MENNSAMKNRSHRRIAIQIIVDIIIWLTVSLPVLYLFLNGRPSKTGFICDDPSLSFPSKSSSVPTPLLLCAGFTLSALLVFAVEVLNCLDRCRGQCRRTSAIMNCVKSYIVFLIGFLVEEMVVEVVKNSSGALRPNFFDVCKPQFNRTRCPGYISEYKCIRSEEDKDLRTSRQSFPSGHATFAMYTAVYFSIYLETRLKIRFSRLLKIFLQSSLVLIAILCGLGRIKDNKHHSSDVIAGFILGIIVAFLIYVLMLKKMTKSSSVLKTASLKRKDKQCECCCTCEQSDVLNLQTPLPSLRNECINTKEIERDTSTSKLISLENNNHSHSSTNSSLSETV